MVEAECFPPAEAATEKGFVERVRYYGNKEELILYYGKFGFKDEGISNKSTHGNVVWRQMRLSF